MRQPAVAMTVSIAPDRNRVLPSRVKAEWWSDEIVLAERLVALRDRVLAELGTESALPVIQWDAPWRSAEIVSTLTHSCIQRLRHTSGSEVDAGHRLCGLVLDLQQLAMDIYLYDTAMRGQRLAGCGAALSRLRGIPTSDSLLDSVCEELVSRCGFHRAVLSRVEGSYWKPLMLHERSAPDGGSWFDTWINQTVPIAGSNPESEVASRRRPSLVHDTANAPVYRPLIVQSGNSRSYVVAPLVHGDDVVGFLHTDHFPLPRRTDESDREVLWAFADGFGHIYERTMLLERLREQRDSVRDLFFSAVDRIDELCEAGLEATRRGDEDGELSEGTAVMRSHELTEREAEVFDLMVTGATNQAIADKLVITEGTVKSHVKHILRKYGAVNRAQAIAWALR